MGFEVKIIADSIGPHGKRLTTLTATYPRFIHSELLTHRMLARNSASSRAIPWKRKGKEKLKIKDMPKGAKPIGEGIFREISLDPDAKYDYFVPNCMYSMIMNEPVVPISFGLEQQGMQSGAELTGADRDKAEMLWRDACDTAVKYADQLSALGVHKSICNRLIEPWMWITVVISATDWNNFFRLRCHPDAEKHFQKIAFMIRNALRSSEPKQLGVGDWHLPYVEMDDVYEINEKKLYDTVSNPWARISGARCARVSYLTHEGKRDIQEDFKLASKLIERPDDVIHASALEHPAECVAAGNHRSGPFHGWKQFRKFFPNENVLG